MFTTADVESDFDDIAADLAEVNPPTLTAVDGVALDPAVALVPASMPRSAVLRTPGLMPDGSRTWWAKASDLAALALQPATSLLSVTVAGVAGDYVLLTMTPDPSRTIVRLDCQPIARLA